MPERSLLWLVLAATIASCAGTPASPPPAIGDPVRDPQIDGPQPPAAISELDLAQAVVSLENARVASGSGDAAQTRAEVQSAIEILVSEPELGREEVDRMLLELAELARSSGDLRTSVRARRWMCARREQLLPQDDPNLLRAWNNLASNLGELSELEEALELHRRVLAARERTLRHDDPELLRARGNLANTLRELGRSAEAAAHQEQVLLGFERTLPPDHPDRARAQLNLAATYGDLGDRARARALEERAWEARRRALHPDHPDVLRAEENLAATRFAMGDVAAALAAFEHVASVRERDLPPDHPDLLLVRSNLAAALAESGDLAGARALLEQSIEGALASLPGDHTDLLDAQLNLAAVLRELRDEAGARRIEEEVLAVRERTLPPEHPDHVSARHALANTLAAMGELEAARALEAEVVEVLERTRPADDVALVDARFSLAGIAAQAADREAMNTQLESLLAALRRRLENAYALSPREERELAGSDDLWIRELLFLIDESGEGPTRTRESFEVVETYRAHSVAPAEAWREASDSEGLEVVRAAAGRTRSQMNDLVAGGPREGEDATTWSAEIRQLSLLKDGLEKEIRAKRIARGELSAPIRAPEVSAALLEGGLAIGFRRARQPCLDPETRRWRPDQDRYFAHVVSADGTVERIELGPGEEIDELIRAWREAVGTPLAATIAPTPTLADAAGEGGPGRGVSAIGAGVVPDPRRERETGRALRERILDPLIVRGRKGARIHVALDDCLHLVPLDALPLGDGFVGDRFEVVAQASFARWLAPIPNPAGEPSLLALGDVAFDLGAFQPLPETRIELEQVASLFESGFDRAPRILTGESASKEEFRTSARNARFLHVATHGWFAEEALTGEERQPGKRMSSLDAHGSRRTLAGFAPMTLCGLALAGANRGRDSLGRVPGILTAEELASFDLSRCELAVLSACETNVGIRRAGQGIQSLQAALHAAGARTAVTSLWKVDDAATRRLMERFYRGLWIEKRSKSSALWAAKRSLRDEGLPTRDWSGWVLSGSPD